MMVAMIVTARLLIAQYNSNDDQVEQYCSFPLRVLGVSLVYSLRGVLGVGVPPLVQVTWQARVLTDMSKDHD